MGKKAMLGKALVMLVLVVVVIFIMIWIGMDKVGLWSELKTMCGPPTNGGRCGCCYPDGACPTDFEPLTSHPACPDDYDSAGCLSDGGKLCNDDKGWKEIRKLDADTLGQGTCCISE